MESYIRRPRSSRGRPDSYRNRHSNGQPQRTSNAIAVSAATATHFSVNAPGAPRPGLPSTSRAALDQFNNTVTGYAGTVHFTSSDGAIAGEHNTLTMVLFSAQQNAGNQTITAIDTVTGSLTGTSNSIVVRRRRLSARARRSVGLPGALR